MDNSILQKFFDPVRPVSFDRKRMNYDRLACIADLLDAMSGIIPHNTYIVDYYRKNFFYVSERSLILCGYSRAEAMSRGFDFYSQIMSPEDVRRLLEINTAGFRLFYSISKEQRQQGTISYDVMLTQKNGEKICVNERLKPYMFTEDGNMWLAICTMQLSSGTETGNVRCHFAQADSYLQYSLDERVWLSQPCPKFSETEMRIIQETEKGLTDNEIADIIGCTRSNVRYFKTQLMRKTKTLHFKDAIYHASSFGIF